jgi:hypothetical protein
MNNNSHKNSIQDNVLKAIEAGKVKMRPKWHFVARTSLLIVGTILVVLALLYLVSLILFIMRQTGVLFVSGFGFSGISAFFLSAPWLLIIIAVIFIIILQILIKKYSFGYGRPLLYSALAIIVLVVVGGILVEMTPLHRGLFNRAENNGLPLAGGLYRQFGEQEHDNITVGVVTEVLDNGYKITTQGGEALTVTITSQTKGAPGFAIGDTIVVLGSRQDDTIMAEGIRIFDGEMRSGHGGDHPPGPPPGHR